MGERLEWVTATVGATATPICCEVLSRPPEARPASHSARPERAAIEMGMKAKAVRALAMEKGPVRLVQNWP
jgi:hypothetical protein